MTQVLWTATSQNTKTGDVPTGWVGESIEKSKASCDKAQCPLRPWAQEDRSGIRCYAFNGSPVMGFHSLLKSSRDHSLEHAVTNRNASAKIIRIGAIGDPGVMPLAWWRRTKKAADEAGLKVISYTHAWWRRPDLVGFTMASVDSFEEAQEAVKMGFRVALATRDASPLDKLRVVDGQKYIVCPHIAMKARGAAQPVNCNRCQLCAADHRGPHVLFPDHGVTARRKR